MPRTARTVVPGCPHHVTHRGNGRRDIFLTSDDREAYRERLREDAGQQGLGIWAYCLMTNHVHLVVVPEQANSLAQTLGRAHGRYSQWINLREGSSGHLWENRFRSAPMDMAHLWAATRYVELNPVRAGLVRCAEEYLWSSARAHVHGTQDDLLSLDLPFGAPNFGREWQEWLAQGLDDAVTEAIRECTVRGYPLGSADFVAQVLGR